jgi:hypothetical protein
MTKIAIALASKANPTESFRLAHASQFAKASPYNHFTSPVEVAAIR